jgi:hypothetical protein
VTAVDERLTRPLRSGNQLTMVGLAIVVLAQLPGPVSRIAWLLNLAGVVATTWGSVRVTTWLARFCGRRSLTEAAIGIGLVGTAVAVTITISEGPLNRADDWTVGIAAVGFAVLGLALIGTAVAAYRAELDQIENPPPADPPKGAISRPQPAGVRLPDRDAKVLRLTSSLAAASFTLTFLAATLHS